MSPEGSYYERHREEIKAYHRAQYQKNREERLADAREYRRKNPEKVRACLRQGRLKLRTQTLEAYGNRCTCCGEDEPAFLAVDHVNNDGAEHRRVIGEGSSALYRWLRDNGYPKDRFQLLCHNCNTAKHTQGECPHVTRGLEEEEAV